MAQFYAQSRDEEHCKDSVIRRSAITITGLTLDGQLRPFTGTVESVETGHTTYPDYPLLVTILDSN